MKRVMILGSTGSVGRNALDVIRHMRGRLRAAGLSARSRWELLAEQVCEFEPDGVAIASSEDGALLRARLGESATRLFDGPSALIEMIQRVEADVFLTAIVGAAGLPVTLEVAKSGRLLALANKEPLVMAGGLIMRLAEENQTTIVPVDSEHSAIFQTLRAGRRCEVRKVVITASGGAFRDVPIEELSRVTPEQALEHPTWDMGPKVTIDSATLMNKALEIVEAKWLFGLDADQIQVVIHPQSIVHSMVEFCDGSVVAQLSVPDMRTPIQFALTFPERLEAPARRLDLVEQRTLTFQEPDPERFSALGLGFEAARSGGTLGAVLNAANEVAVERFIHHRIAFPDIVRITEKVMSKHKNISEPTMEDILAADGWAREEAAVCL